MILSVHIPKTAGRSFQHYLHTVFGSRLLDDHGDWPELKAVDGLRHNESRRLTMFEQADRLRREYNTIHGHYRAEKYNGVFADARILAFVRDPYQHAVSAHEHALRSDLTPEDRPGIGQFRKNCMSVAELVQAFPDHQSSYLSGLALDDLAMVALTEHYERSITLFRKVFGVATHPKPDRRNINPSRRGDVYTISEDTRRAVDTYRTEDVALYRRALERFEMQARRHGL